MDKIFITAEELLLDPYRLSMHIINGDFRPYFIVGLWRGSSPVGIAVQDYLDYLGIKTDHISIRTSYRKLDNYDYMVNNAHDIRIATTWYKPTKNTSPRKPDFCVNETHQWRVLPYELNALSDAEIALHKPQVTALANGLKF